MELIDRQAAIDALIACKGKDPFNRYEKQNIGLDWGIEALEQLPSVQPEPLTLRVNRELTKEEYDKLMQDIKDAPIVQLPSAQPDPQWIPCSERLPDKTTTVIVSCIDNSGDTPFSYTDCGYWVGLLPDDDPAWIVDGEVNYHVFAWMPLPSPYKGEQE